MKVLVGIPCGDTVKARTAFSLFQLRGAHSLIMQIGSDIAHNRNKLVAQAMDFTHLLFIDADMSFAPDTLERMLKHDKDILGLAANHRRLPLESVVKPLTNEDLHKPLPIDLFECASVGTGVMLIKTDVLNTISAPWFDFEYVDGERVGEDVSFCRKAREVGYSIWVDPTIPVRHLGEYQY